MKATRMVGEMDGAGLALETREDERSEDDRVGGASPAGDDSTSSLRRGSDPEVSDKATRRTYSAKYKLKVLREADRCRKPGEIGALLRREGLYSSLLSAWRRQRDGGLTVKKRGRDGAARDKLAAENKRLRREARRLERRLRNAETIIDIQKKASELLGIPLNSPELDEDE